MTTKDEPNQNNTNTECEYLRLELTRSMLHNDVSAIDKLLNTISKVGCSQQLEAEVSSAGLLLQRLNSQRKLVLDDLTSSLHKSDITELRSLCNPPQMVVQCVTATMMLIGVKEKQASWEYFKRYISGGVFEALVNFNIESVTPEVALKVQNVLQDVSMEKVMNVSKACAGLYQWSWENFKRYVCGGVFEVLKNFNVESVTPEVALKVQNVLQDVSMEKVMKVSKACAGLYQWVI